MQDKKIKFPVLKTKYYINGECIDKYTGFLSSSRRDMEKNAWRATNSYTHQVGRCRNPKDSRYSSYGGRGISVEYKKRPFMSWWLHHYNISKPEFPSIHRIDNDGNYEFGNVALIESGENTAEMNTRTKSIAVDVYHDGKYAFRCASMTVAGRFTGQTFDSVWGSCRKLLTKKNNGCRWNYRIAGSNEL